MAGGHLNPAVTAAFLLTKKISLIKAGLYWAAQLAGAVLGSFLVKYVSPAISTLPTILPFGHVGRGQQTPPESSTVCGAASTSLATVQPALASPGPGEPQCQAAHFAPCTSCSTSPHRQAAMPLQDKHGHAEFIPPGPVRSKPYLSDSSVPLTATHHPLH